MLNITLINAGPAGITSELAEHHAKYPSEITIVTERTFTHKAQRDAWFSNAPRSHSLRAPETSRAGILFDFSRYSHPPSISRAVKLPRHLAKWATAVTLSLRGFPPILLVAMYTPNELSTDYAPLMHALNDFLTTVHPDFEIVVGGDWNCVLDDQTRNTTSATAKASQEALRQVLEDQELVDAHLRWNSRATPATNTHHAKSRRLDRCYTTMNLAPLVSRVTVFKKAFPHSHHPITFSFHIDSESTIPVSRGPGYWKLPYEILVDDCYRPVISRCIAASYSRAIQESTGQFQGITAQSLNTPLTTVAQYDQFMKHLRKYLQAITRDWRDRVSCSAELQDRVLANTLSLHAKLPFSVPREETMILRHSAKANKRKGTVQEIEYQGEATEDPAKMLSAFTDLYSELYTSEEDPAAATIDSYLEHLPLPSLTEQQRRQASEELDAKTLTVAMRKCPRRSTPGPSGLPMEFYRVFSDDMIPIIEMWTAAALREGRFGDSTLSYVRVIPKDDPPAKSVRNFRPLALMNTDLKIVTQALNIKALQYADTIIAPDQTGFLPGRSILRNMAVMQTALEYRNFSNPAESNVLASNVNAVNMLALDFEKAYDRPAREFLLKVLEKFGFPPYFCRLVEASLCETRGAVIVNGHIGPEFPICTGVRQGDPLSPFLFALMVEPLLGAIRELQCGPRASFPYMNSSLYRRHDRRSYKQVPPTWAHPARFSVTAFADDITIAVKTPAELVAVSRCLEQYCSASRARLNYKKSNLIYNSSHSSLLTQSLPLEHPLHNCAILDTATQSFRYLGVQLGANAATVQWKATVDRIESILRGFYFAKAASIAAAAYINTFALSTLVFASAVHPPPKKELVRLKSLVRAKMKAGKTRSPIAFDVMTLPRRQGGLGLLDPDAVIAGRQALYWYHINATPSFARSTILGAMQSLTLQESDKLLSIRGYIDRHWWHGEPANTAAQRGSLVPLPCEQAHPAYFFTTWQIPHVNFTNPAPNPFKAHQKAMNDFALPEDTFQAWEGAPDYGGFHRPRSANLDDGYGILFYTPQNKWLYYKNSTTGQRTRQLWTNPGRTAVQIGDMPPAAQRFFLKHDRSDAFNPLEPSRLESFRDHDQHQLHDGSFRQAQPKARAPQVYLKNGEVRCDNMAVPKGFPIPASLPRDPQDYARACAELLDTLRSFWESFAPLQKQNMTIAHTWRLYLQCTLALPGTYGTAWLQKAPSLAYTGTECPLCREDQESQEHLLFDCTVVDSWWEDLQELLPARPIDYCDLYNSFPAQAPFEDRLAWHDTLASFWHAVYRLVVYYRWHNGEGPPVDQRHLVDFIRDWLVHKGTRKYPSIRGQEPPPR